MIVTRAELTLNIKLESRKMGVGSNVRGGMKELRKRTGRLELIICHKFYSSIKKSELWQEKYTYVRM